MGLLDYVTHLTELNQWMIRALGYDELQRLALVVSIKDTSQLITQSTRHSQLVADGENAIVNSSHPT